MRSTPLDPRSVRAGFALAPGVAHLNHGSYGATPLRVLDAQSMERRAMEADPVGYMERVPGRVREVARRVARRFGSDDDGVALVDNATTGVSTVLASLDLRPGDRLVCTSHGYGAVRHALQAAARRSGAVVDEVDVPFPLAYPAEVVAAVAPRLAGARFAVLDAITSPTGLVFPIQALVDACRAEGVPVLVDGAHAPGQIPLALMSLGADWFCGNLHKWVFAAKGAALLWAAPERRAETRPLVVSHGWPEGWPRAFDFLGTRDPTPWLTVPDALDVADALEGDDGRLSAHNVACTEAMAAELSAAFGRPLPAPASMRRFLATVALPRHVAADGAPALHAALRARGVQVPVIPFQGACWVRVSGQAYVEAAWVDRLIDAVRDALG